MVANDVRKALYQTTIVNKGVSYDKRVSKARSISETGQDSLTSMGTEATSEISYDVGDEGDNHNHKSANHKHNNAQGRQRGAGSKGDADEATASSSGKANKRSGLKSSNLGEARGVEEQSIELQPQSTRPRRRNSLPGTSSSKSTITSSDNNNNRSNNKRPESTTALEFAKKHQQKPPRDDSRKATIGRRSSISEMAKMLAPSNDEVRNIAQFSPGGTNRVASLFGEEGKPKPTPEELAEAERIKQQAARRQNLKQKITDELSASQHGQGQLTTSQHGPPETSFKETSFNHASFSNLNTSISSGLGIMDRFRSKKSGDDPLSVAPTKRVSNFEHFLNMARINNNPTLADTDDPLRTSSHGAVRRKSMSSFGLEPLKMPPKKLNWQQQPQAPPPPQEPSAASDTARGRLASFDNGVASKSKSPSPEDRRAAMAKSQSTKNLKPASSKSPGQIDRRAVMTRSGSVKSLMSTSSSRMGSAAGKIMKLASKAKVTALKSAFVGKKKGTDALSDASLETDDDENELNDIASSRWSKEGTKSLKNCSDRGIDPVSSSDELSDSSKEAEGKKEKSKEKRERSERRKSRDSSKRSSKGEVRSSNIKARPKTPHRGRGEEDKQRRQTPHRRRPSETRSGEDEDRPSRRLARSRSRRRVEDESRSVKTSGARSRSRRRRANGDERSTPSRRPKGDETSVMSRRRCRSRRRREDGSAPVARSASSSRSVASGDERARRTGRRGRSAGRNRAADPPGLASLVGDEESVMDWENMEEDEERDVWEYKGRSKSQTSRRTKRSPSITKY